ncbi:MAG: hypothetical protein OEZ00_06940 [Dehalococcoidia bacterium]|nr:hypothetical protein [Dehalococcoidia bacterium]
MRKFIYTLFAVVLVLALTLLPASPASAALYYLREHYTTGQDATTAIYPTDMWCAQSFTAMSNHKVDYVNLKLSRAGFPGTVTVSLRATDNVSGHPTGPALASGTTNGNDLTTDNNTTTGGDLHKISFVAAYDVIFGTKYAIVWSADNVTDGNNCLYSHEDASDPTYTGGNMLISNNSGVDWTSYPDTDFMFEVWGATPSPPTEVWVDDDYCALCTNDGHTWGTDAFPTIQGGIDVVAADGTVNVATGTYSEHVTIGKSLALRAGSAPIIDAGGSGVAVTIGASNVSIIGFTIQNAVIGISVTSGASNAIHWCNINIKPITPSDWGLWNMSGNLVDAKNNWWGASDGPSSSGPSTTGSRVSSNVEFDPWLGSSLTNSKTEYCILSSCTVDALTEADTEVEKSGAGYLTIFVAKYSSNPGDTPAFSAIGKYIDVHIDSTFLIDWIEIRVYYTSAEIVGVDESSLKLYWWNAPDWVECSNTGVTYPAGGPTYSGYIWAYINGTTTPTLTQLVGSAFGGGGAAAAAAAGAAAAGCIPVISNLTITPTEVKPGETVTITVEAKNIGDTICIFPVILKINGVVVEKKMVTLVPGEKKTVTFTVIKDEVGTYEVQVSRLKGEFIVSKPLPSPASFKATGLSISPTKVGVGETVDISVLVTETGGGSGNYNVILKVNGVVMGKQEVTLGSQQSQTVTFTITNQQTGNHTVELNGLVGKFIVEVPPGAPPAPPPAEVINWWLIISIIAGCLIITVVIWQTARQRY